MDSRGQIENLLAQYCHLLDDGRFEELGSCFIDGTVRITGGPCDGRSANGAAEATELYREIVLLDANGATGTRHMISSIRVVVDGDSAVSHCYFAVLQQTASLALQVVASGYYDDQFRRTASRWGFAVRHIVCDQTGDLTQHIR